jgi:hypothetical protein
MLNYLQAIKSKENNNNKNERVHEKSLKIIEIKSLPERFLSGK